mmetsp:Transcript_32921/g.104807  ORF Transcript_32921/g.104807 Transcript_32921/m.104807 type:complete len:220 (+) Transcript_32921:735-1394(+)
MHAPIPRVDPVFEDASVSVHVVPEPFLHARLVALPPPPPVHVAHRSPPRAPRHLGGDRAPRVALVVPCPVHPSHVLRVLLGARRRRRPPEALPVGLSAPFPELPAVGAVGPIVRVRTRRDALVWALSAVARRPVRNGGVAVSPVESLVYIEGARVLQGGVDALLDCAVRPPRRALPRGVAPAGGHVDIRVEKVDAVPARVALIQIARVRGEGPVPHLVV